MKGGTHVKLDIRRLAVVLCAWSDVFVKRVIGPINSQKHILILSLESYQWNDEISIGFFWHRTDFQTL